MLEGMVDPVRLVFFTQSLSCETCQPTRQILDELAGLDDRISVDEQNFILDKDAISKYGVDRVPAIALVAAGRDTGIRFYGVPAGYEFSALVDAIAAASKGQPGLSDASHAQLSAVGSPVHIQVFVTPT